MLQCEELSLPLLAKVTFHSCNTGTLNEFLPPRSQGKSLRLEEVSVRNLAERNILGESFSSGKKEPHQHCNALQIGLGKKKGK